MITQTNGNPQGAGLAPEKFFNKPIKTVMSFTLRG